MGEGDIGGQINNISILRANGAGEGFPVTALVNINAAGQNQQSMLNLAQAIQSAGFFPIIRLTHVCESFDSGVTANNAVANARNAFGDSAIIIYGNEVNNREAECSNWPKYVSDYNSIADKSNVSPAALDYYMGNPDFTVDRFFATPGAAAIYSGSSVNAANAYGCVGRSEADCTSPFTPNTEAQGYASYNGTVYLTEFSLSPEGRSATAPDTNLEKVVEFIENNAAGTGVGIITPLVRNVCNSTGEWLLYVNGKLFTINGTEVSTSCEGGGGGSIGAGYDLSKYPDYGFDSTSYYLHPIKGIHPLSTPSQQNVSVARLDLASQGYQPHCAAEPTNIKLDLNTRQLIDRYLDLYPSGVRPRVDSVFTLDSAGGQTPIFRDTTGKRFLTSSLEEFFGFKDVYNEDEGYSYQELRTAPINSLLSQEQKCIQGVDILRNIQLMCERLDDPASCALLANEIPGTSYNVGRLLEEVDDVIPGYRAGKIPEQCRMLFQNEIPEFAYETPELQVFKKAIVNVPLYIDKSYRLAFLVAAIEQRPTTSAFNFFSFFADAQPKHEVMMVAFKIPDILTNKGGGETSGHQYFNDAASLTRNILVPAKFKLSEDEDTPGYDKKSRDMRTNLAADAANAAQQNTNSAIYCLDGAGNTPAELNNMQGSAACKDVLGKAVVDLINGQTPSCSNLQAEPVRQILQEAKIIPPEGDHATRFFNDGYGFGTDVLNYIFLNNTGGPQRQETTFRSILNLVSGAFGGAEDQTAKVDFYLVYPMGYELDSVTEVMKNTFFTAEQILALEKDNTKNRFETTGFAARFSGGSYRQTYLEDPRSGNCEERTEYLYWDLVTGAPFIPPLEYTVHDCERSFDINVTQDGSGGLTMLGADLGFWVRNIQKSLNSYFSTASAYITSCATTEQFLLGRCAGGSALPAPADDDYVPPPASGTCGADYPIQANDIVPDYYAQTIISPSRPGYNDQIPETPDVGRAMYYSAGLMNRVLANRISWGQIPASVKDCEGGDSVYRGCVALLRFGDIGRDVWLRRPGENVEGPYKVIDVAARHDIPCLLERDWVVDVDWGTASRWGMRGPVPAQICETPACN